MMKRMIPMVLAAVVVGVTGEAWAKRGAPSVPPTEKVVGVAAPGAYRLTFDYVQPSTAAGNLQVRIQRVSTGETTHFRLVDYVGNFPAVPSKPLAPAPEAGKAPKRTAELDVAFETAEDYKIVISGAMGVRANEKGWRITSANPTVTDLALKAAGPAVPAPQGFVPARPVGFSAKLRSALPARERLQLSYHQCFSYYDDPIEPMQYGATFNYQGTESDRTYRDYDTLCVGKCEFKPGADFAKKYGDEGKCADAAGNPGKAYSFSFKPYREACYDAACASVREISASEKGPSVLNWFSAWEQAGTYDYGPTSMAAFRGEYLPAKYGTVEKLNAAWHTAYKSFDEVRAAEYKECVGDEKHTNFLELCRAKASFVDFRDFNSKAYASYLGLKSKAIFENDPMHRPLTSQYSNNNLGSICWLKWRPLSFEDSMQLTIKPSPTMGFDIYATDDLTAESFEHWVAFSDDQCEPMVKEGNTHALGAEVGVRTFYNLFGEGMKGSSLFTLQESPKPELRKFGMLDVDDDFSPRPKLAGYADMYRALGQLEPFFAYAKRMRVGKPVAIYYSQTCNVLADRGYGSMFDCQPDSHNRVFELCRQAGYACTVVTDRQILETDRLEGLSAVFFLDAQYVPDAVVDRVASWVAEGGHVVADGQTGAFDDHGFPSRKFVDFLGIEPIVKTRVAESAAANLEFGYSSQSYEVVNPDGLWLTMREWIHQRDARHPLAKAWGKIMFSGFGYQNVKSLDGEVIVLGNNGEVGWNLRTVGKGSASYFAGYLGTLYGAGCTQYEWRDLHADETPRRMFAAMLDWFGARKNGTTDLEDGWCVRQGSPLVDKKGNVTSVIVNFADHTLAPFRATVNLPAGAKAPRAAYFTRDASREIVKLDFTYDEKANAVSVNVPSLRVFGNLLLVQDQDYPLVSAKAVDPVPGTYRLPELKAGGELVYETRVVNASPRTLPAGTLTLRLPDGWFYDRETAQVPEVPAFGLSEPIRFRIRAPGIVAANRLLPVNFVWTSGEKASTPAVGSVWLRK